MRKWILQERERGLMFPQTGSEGTESAFAAPHCRRNDIWTELWICSLDWMWWDQNTVPGNNINSISRKHQLHWSTNEQWSLIHILMNQVKWLLDSLAESNELQADFLNKVSSSPNSHHWFSCTGPDLTNRSHYWCHTYSNSA